LKQRFCRLFESHKKSDFRKFKRLEIRRLEIQPISNLLFTLVILMTLLSACGRIQQNQSQSIDATLEMTLEPAQPAVGPAHLIFTLTDAQGQPINDATLAIEGNMTHAGMVPVVTQAESGLAGRYSAPFEWTMGGDWVVTVETTLADGRHFSREFPVTVQ